MSQFCTNCENENIEDAIFCSSCGSKLAGSSSNMVGTSEKIVPEDVVGWSWGAFLIAPIWAIGNKTYIGLLALIPYIGIIVAIIMGVKGREWAWKNNEWDNLEHFNRVQRRWSLWSALGIILAIALAILVAVAIPRLAATREEVQADSADKFFAKKFGEEAWAFAPEETKAGWKDALANNPEAIGKDAVEFTKSQKEKQ